MYVKIAQPFGRNISTERMLMEMNCLYMIWAQQGAKRDLQIKMKRNLERRLCRESSSKINETIIYNE